VLSSELLGYSAEPRVLIINADELPAGLSEWAVHPGLGDVASRKIDNGWRVRHTDLEFLISPEARTPYARNAS
jgi:hypothetical protein